MGVENIIGIRFGKNANVAHEPGVPYFNDVLNNKAHITDYDGVEKTFAFEEDIVHIKRFLTSGGGKKAYLVHNLNNDQVQVMVNEHNLGSVGEFILCDAYPTLGNELNSTTVETLEPKQLYVTITG